MADRRRFLAGMAATFGTAVTAPALATVPAAAGESAAALLDTLAWELIALSPPTATGLGVDTGAHAALRGQMGEAGFAGVAADKAFLTSALARLAQVPRAGLDATTATSLAVAESAFRTALAGHALPYGDITIGGYRNTPYVVIQNAGAWLDIPQMLDGDQPLNNSADADYYVERLAGTAAQFDGETARIAAARESGLVPPDFLLDKTIAGLEATIADTAKPDGPFIGPLSRKSGGTDAVVPPAALARAAQVARDAIAPALARQLAELRAQRAVATAEAGMLHRPHGAEFYAWALRASTTTTRSAAELHATGLAQLRELHARMDAILRGMGLTRGSIAARAAAVQRRPEMAFANDDEGRRQIIAYMQDRLDAMRAQLPRAFRRLTRGSLEIRRLPLAQEPGAPAAYGGPGSIDGSIPGKVWVNLRDPSIHNRVTIPDLMFHEGIPGHVWQGEYAQKLPLIRSILAFNAYQEGWALYCEQMADELGLYDHDPAGRLGMLIGLAWRAVRLVVDTGIHAMGWSRERALTTFMEATGELRPNAESEIDRYCAWPGQACGYMVGMQEILRLRARARAALGWRYDLRDFNQAVVDGGNVPLDVLAGNVARYIAVAP